MDADFARLGHYAHRVQRILDESDHDIVFPPRTNKHVFPGTVMDALAPHFGKRTLLPNLNILHIHPCYSEPLTFYRSLPILFGPRLHTFYTRCSNYSGENGFDCYENMLTKLREVAPRLQAFNVSLEFSIRPLRLVAAVSTVMCSFDHLLGVYTDQVPVTLQALIHLAKLPRLHHMAVKVGDKLTDEDLATLRRSVGKTRFNNLRELHLVHQTNLPLLVNVIRLVRSHFLKAISISLNDPVKLPVQSYKDLFSHLSRRKGKGAIQTLRISAHPDRSNDPVITEDMLEPLLELTNLKEFSFNPGCRFEIDNYLLQAMASSWKNLTLLELGPDSHEGPTEVTLSALLPFVYGCPKLWCLGLNIDTDVKKLERRYRVFRPGFGKTHHALTTLKLGRSQIADPVSVAAYLSDLFPNLENLESDWDFEDDIDEPCWTEEEREEIRRGAAVRERWNDVEWHLMPAFLKVREQERRWAEATE